MASFGFQIISILSGYLCPHYKEYRTNLEIPIRLYIVHMIIPSIFTLCPHDVHIQQPPFFRGL